MGQATSVISDTVASYRPKSYTDANSTTGTTDKPQPESKKESLNSNVLGASDCRASDGNSYRGSDSKSWLGPSPKPSPSDTKTAISPGPEKFKIPHDKEDMLKDCSKHDTLVMMPVTESQIFLLKEEKLSSEKDTVLVTPKKSAEVLETDKKSSGKNKG